MFHFYLKKKLYKKYKNYINRFNKVSILSCLNLTSLNKKNIIFLFLIYKLKLLSFHDIENLLSNLINMIVLRKNLYKKFIVSLLKKRFWDKISTFLLFYLKNNINVYKNLKIQFYIIDEVNVNLLKKYITVRLQQRFQVSQLLAPVLRDLKRRKNILGFKFSFSGRFSRKEMATYEWFANGPVPLSTFNSNLEYISFPVRLKDGICGIKIWLNKKPLILKSYKIYDKIV